MDLDWLAAVVLLLILEVLVTAQADNSTTGVSNLFIKKVRSIVIYYSLPFLFNQHYSVINPKKNVG